MGAEAKGAAAGSPVAASPLDRDPRRFPFGVLMVAPGIFESVSGFSWFASQADAVEYLRTGVWPYIELDEARKQACMQVFATVLSGRETLTEDVVAELGQRQEELIVAWVGTFQQIVDGTDSHALVLLTGTAEQVGMPELLDSADGLLGLMGEYRWNFTGGKAGVRAIYDSLSEEEQERLLADLQTASLG